MLSDSDQIAQLRSEISILRRQVQQLEGKIAEQIETIQALNEQLDRPKGISFSKKTIVYVSGALTGVANLDELKRFYEDIGIVCEEFQMEPYIPHKHTDPDKNPEISAKDVFDEDRKWIWQSDLVIAYIGTASLGVGSELQIAATSQVPVIALYEKGPKKVSRMARGNPAIKQHVLFTTFGDALEQLRAILAKEYSRIHFAKKSRETKQTFFDFAGPD